ncbi:uncharacterized protein LOC122052788 isoform X1 [Zingiber officinale]|uniref:uncharacterized protein LOC122052788 isoform X1 n=1 Tax=Zingiber officinale TaxID=94328 RepID=UPI001C4D4BD0|nr:uncharacterized protein LOC122052788 isoform X1 [Zingiber officinale]
MTRFLNAGTLAGASTASSCGLVSRSRASVVLNLRRFSSRPQKVQLFELEVDADGSSSEVEVLGMRRLEDAIRAIIVRRSAPDWLPFVPGSSYWVPPRRRHHGRHRGVVEFISSLTNPMTDEEMMSFTTARGWPSSAYFVGGTSLHSRKESQERTNVKSDDEES